MFVDEFGSLANVFQHATGRRRCLRLEQGRGDMTRETFWRGKKKGQLVGGCSGGDVDPYDVQIYVYMYYVYISINIHVLIDRYL